MKYYESTKAVCPFYTQEQALKIHCEGVVKGSSIQLSFYNVALKKLYRNRYCLKDGYYKRCPLYQAILKQYKQENNDDSI